jgi:hypothetical protein
MVAAVLLLVAIALTGIAIDYVAEGRCVSAVHALWHPTDAPTCKFTHSVVNSVLAYGWLAVVVAVVLLLMLALTLPTTAGSKPVVRRPRSALPHQLTQAELSRRRAALTPEDPDRPRRATSDVFGPVSTPVRADAAFHTSTGARIPIDEALRWRVWRRDGLRCVVCGAESRLTIDHIYPVSLGGTNDESNLQTLCRSCNSRKGARFS